MKKTRQQPVTFETLEGRALLSAVVNIETMGGNVNLNPGAKDAIVMKGTIRTTKAVDWTELTLWSPTLGKFSRVKAADVYLDRGVIGKHDAADIHVRNWVAGDPDDRGNINFNKEVAGMFVSMTSLGAWKTTPFFVTFDIKSDAQPGKFNVQVGGSKFLYAKTTTRVPQSQVAYWGQNPNVNVLGTSTRITSASVASYVLN